MIRILSKIKQKIVPAGNRPRTILAGPFRGLKMDIDLTYQTQVSNLKLNRFRDSSRLEISSKFVSATNNEKECSLGSFVPSMAFPCLVKMDVEGGEVDILKGCPQSLRESQSRWLIETHSKPLEEERIRILQPAGFQVRIIPNAWWRIFLPELRIHAHNRWLVASQDLNA